MSVNFPKMQQIFLSAVEQHRPEEWEAYLEQACAGDDELRNQVKLLLKAHLAAGSVPGAATGEQDQTGAYKSAAEASGTTIGPYKLIEPIGEGGMGTVWMAQQTEPVKRLVALKLIKAGMDSKQVIARFEAERQALALMDHPNIAKVLDAGTTGISSGSARDSSATRAYASDSARPYFVMELVKGVPITKHCDDNHLTPRERLELFIPVCQAVQHAHQKGVIHRDLKPSNVLVALYDGKPVPKVIDFGVAKAAGQSLTDKTLVTGFGAIVGTLEYMSPEQAEINQLDIDTRSDIYSLGVLLYELLAGSTPFTRKGLEKAGMLELLRVIREDEPSKPSTKLSTAEGLPTLAANRGTEPAKLTKLVRGELDWIVMKALEKNRNRRYETAIGFAMDVQRYLADEQVLACPPSVSYRLKKFTRRNKGPLAAACLVLLALVVGVVGTTAGFLRAEQQRQNAERNEQKAIAAAEAEKHERHVAEAREAEAKALVQFLEEKVIAAARPEGQAGGLGRQVTVREALETALPEVCKRFVGQPLVEARLRHTLGVSFANLGEAKIAVDQVEKARTIRAQHLGPDHADTLASSHNLANCYYALGRHSESLKLREETLALLKAKFGLDDATTLAAMNSLALSYAMVGERDKALKLNEETYKIRKLKFGPDDPGTLGTMNNLAGMYSGLGRHDEALKLGLETVARLKVRHGPRHRSTLNAIDTLASIYHNRGQFHEAVKLLEEILPIMRDVLGPGHAVTLSSMMALANGYAALGRYSEELKVREDTVALRQVRLDPGHPDTLDSLNRLAGLLAVCPDLKVQDPKRAVALAQESKRLAPQSNWSWQVLGWASYRTGDWQGCITAMEKSIALRTDGGDSFPWFFLAMAHWQLADQATARRWYDRSVEWMITNAPNEKYLLHFRAEADELMGNKTK